MSEAEYGKYRNHPAASRAAGGTPVSQGYAQGVPPHHQGLPPDQPAGLGGALVSRGQKLLNILGAVGSIALVVGLGWWGWDLAMRDARGVPVVRALEGPMRVAPEDPGGRVVDHQGLSVNDVAAEGGVAPPPDRLVLAPAPVELTLEDAPGLGAPPTASGQAAGQASGQGAPAAPADPLTGEMANMPAQLDDPTAPVPETPAVSEPDAVSLALAEALGLSPEEIPSAAPEAPAGTLNRSPRPKARPANAGAGGAAPAVANAPAVAVTAPTVVDPATLTPGTRLVQFGAYDSREQAEAEWTKLAGRFSALMAGKSMVVQSAESGGQTFWRLRAHGFENEQESRRFCAALEAEGAKCIPVAHR